MTEVKINIAGRENTYVIETGIPVSFIRSNTAKKEIENLLKKMKVGDSVLIESVDVAHFQTVASALNKEIGETVFTFRTVNENSKRLFRV